MNSPSWKYAFSSVAGTSHTDLGTTCQDFSQSELFKTSEGTEALAMVASDGAGSAKQSEVASALACARLLQEFKLHFECGGSVTGVDRDFATNWLVSFQNEIKARAQHEELDARDFACTLLAAVIGTDCAAFFQIGDGAIIVSSPEDPTQYDYVFWPQQGEYANQTYFITDSDATKNIQHSLTRGYLDEVAIITDGIQGLALHYASMSVHSAFFEPIFSWLRTASEHDSNSLAAPIISFLNSDRVNERTNDDKTLMLATRRALAETPVSKSDDAQSVLQ